MSFAAISTPRTTPLRLLHALLWLEVNLMQFCVSNQSLSPDEDKANKPWRPIPAGRITVLQARTLRWILLPVGLVISGIYNVWLPGFLAMVEILLMNEVNLTSHWFGRNITNTAVYVTLDFAATFIANGGELCYTFRDDTDVKFVADDKQISNSRYLMYLINGMIIVTTIQAQVSHFICRKTCRY